MKIKAVIFDMDGVLVDSEPVYQEWERQFFRQYGIELPDEIYRCTLGQSEADVVDFLEKFWLDQGRREDFRTLYKAYYEAPDFQELNYREVLDESARDVLSFCKNKEMKVALASSSGMADIKKMLSDCGLEDYFQAVISGEQFIKSKPDPEIYLHAAKLLDVRPEECIAVEDSEAGITAAKGAGMYVIAKEERRFQVNQGLADRKIGKLKELEALL